MLRNAPNRTVDCKTFASEYLFHKLSSRCSDLRKEMYDIKYIKGDTVMNGKYVLVYDKEFDRDRQLSFI